MRTVALVSLLLICSLEAGMAQSPSRGREEFTAIALSAGGPRSNPVSTSLDIVVERMSTEADRQRLLAALPKGQDGLLDVLRELPRVGSISTPGQLGWDLRFAQSTRDEDGGRRIFLATDRPIDVWEQASGLRTLDYPFTFIELRVNDAGEGVGRLSIAARVLATRDGRFVQLENWDSEIRLTEVRPRP